ncbi:hypothetical protein C8Q73DRAFT_147480 [Cubamyces lactineus]|nr:hypothetical protein C8Q73DRAFT_147480 [Cubamyces lactineus]
MHCCLAVLQALYAVFLWSGCFAQPLFGPIMLTPNSSTVWTVGSVESVRWCVYHLPLIISCDDHIHIMRHRDNRGLDIPANHHGSIVLGYYDPYSQLPDVGHNFLDQPLAEGFLISDEVVNVLVPPNLPSGKYYYLLLGGDAQNETAVFAIDDPALPSTTAMNLTFPTAISVGQAPSATASSWMPSSTSGVTSPVATSSNATSATATSRTASSPNSTSTHTTTGGSCAGAEIGWARFATPLTVFWILSLMM